MSTSKIEWLKNKTGGQGSTWNPITGCTPASEGCQNCYGLRMAQRLKGRYGYPADDPFKITIHKDKYDIPFKLKRPQRIFVCSMGDLFHDDVPFQEILTIFDIMYQCPQHTFMVLTKRPARMLEFCSKYGLMPVIKNLGLTGSGETWPGNVWCGVSAENQERLNERIPILLKIPAAIKFLSIEPLLGPIDLSTRWCNLDSSDHECQILLDHLNWIIVGGESGPNARIMHPEWVKKIRDDCINKKIPFFFKSWGQWIPHELAHGGPYFSENIKFQSTLRRCKWEDGRVMTAHQDRWCRFLKVGKKYSGRVLDGKIWGQYPAI